MYSKRSLKRIEVENKRYMENKPDVETLLKRGKMSEALEVLELKNDWEKVKPVIDLDN